MMCHTMTKSAMQSGLFDRSDAFPLLITILFALTNGWTTTSLFVSALDSTEPSQRSVAASLLVCFLNTGIFLGASLSFLVRYLDCTPTPTDDCNPFVNRPTNTSGVGAALAAGDGFSAVLGGWGG